MENIVLNKEQFNELHIFEGKIEKFDFNQNELTIHARYVGIPLTVDLAVDYSDLVVLRFKLISYLALTLSGAVSFNLIHGDCNDATKLLGYEGVWGNWDDKIQTDFLLELICQEITLDIPH
ncbi:hypothetical protein [Acinetobacter guillouiae]|uniref:hypothetical protein n=1 Tax=Acinetobacter guillouiae TaxID=106649 RepID=UPI0012502067|nr:hypothetical protein [Acinetobacter guillouiae]